MASTDASGAHAPRITRESLMTLEAYARERPAFRARAMAHKRERTIHVGDHMTLLFEDELTIRYQIQEMLRIEKTFEDAGIADELDAYNPLVPDGTNLKATMLIEYEDEDARRAALARLRGIEDRVFLRVADQDQVFAIADEDLDRETDEKTSSVHFLRFELAPPMIAAFKRGASVTIGVDHPEYRVEVALPEATRKSLAADFA
ncbi:MAG TPA: DUF3501 family protein [Casimicrobiaceae bacterium]|nr:DUF3501 family protein [Casimicrobiaceae bacterium]